MVGTQGGMRSLSPARRRGTRFFFAYRSGNPRVATPGDTPRDNTYRRTAAEGDGKTGGRRCADSLCADELYNSSSLSSSSARTARARRVAPRSCCTDGGARLRRGVYRLQGRESSQPCSAASRRACSKEGGVRKAWWLAHAAALASLDLPRTPQHCFVHHRPADECPLFHAAEPRLALLVAVALQAQRGCMRAPLGRLRGRVEEAGREAARRLVSLCHGVLCTAQPRLAGSEERLKRS
jgi:hypothetical protein